VLSNYFRIKLLHVTVTISCVWQTLFARAWKWFISSFLFFIYNSVILRDSLYTPNLSVGKNEENEEVNCPFNGRLTFIDLPPCRCHFICSDKGLENGSLPIQWFLKGEINKSWFFLVIW